MENGRQAETREVSGGNCCRDELFRGFQIRPRLTNCCWRRRHSGDGVRLVGARPRLQFRLDKKPPTGKATAAPPRKPGALQSDAILEPHASGRRTVRDPVKVEIVDVAETVTEVDLLNSS